jgi:hypothetical protein
LASGCLSGYNSPYWNEGLCEHQFINELAGKRQIIFFVNER